jgi:large subunit ribosomal protein L6
MSRIGNQSITVADGVQVQIVDGSVNVKGPQGEMSVSIPRDITIEQSEGALNVKRSNNVNETKALHGLAQRLVQNAVVGVSKLWEKKLEVQGTGYKVKLQGRDLLFDVGYSHSVTYKSVDGIQFNVQANIVTISGADKQKVGQIADRIKAIRKPDPYKGKGIRYEGEVVKLKPGKKAKTA